MRKLVFASLLALPLLTGGCIAKTAWDVATLPVRAGSQAVDWATTSQEEADRNYGREVREREAREGKELRDQEREERRRRERCEDDPDRRECR